MMYTPSILLDKNNATTFSPFYDVFITKNQEIVAIGPNKPNSFRLHGINVSEGFTIISGDNCVKSNHVSFPNGQIILVTFKDCGILHNSSITMQNNNGPWKRDYIVQHVVFGKGDFSISTIIKNESKLILPWIEYHLSIGFTCIYIYDNGSYDRQTLIDKLKPHIDNQTVILIDWPFAYMEEESGISGQITQQNHSLYLAKNVHKWMAMIDNDEFIVPMKDFNISDFLLKYESSNVSAVNLQCQWFGCNRGAIFTEENYLQKLTRRQLEPVSVGFRGKCIVKPNQVESHCVHIVIKSTEGSVVNANPVSEARFNHYYSLGSKHRHCDHAAYDAVVDVRILDIMMAQKTKAT